MVNEKSYLKLTNGVINPFFPNGGVERTNHGFVDNSPLTSTATMGIRAQMAY